jgi:riboflavin synthase
MFTGLIEGIGKVKGIRPTGGDRTLTIEPLFSFTACRVGESVSVDGVCLTVTGLREGSFSVDVSSETLACSTLGLLKQGEDVNLERALRLADRLGGHLVSGHVDAIGKILRKEPRQRSWFVRIGVDHNTSKYIIEKGSIAVDGISLTVNRCGDRFFEVNIIPQTGRETGLLKKKVGAQVNIETDMIGKYVEKFLTRDRSMPGGETRSGIDREMLMKNGFGD